MKIKATFVKDGKWWVAWTEDVPGALTQGKTIEEAKVISKGDGFIWIKRKHYFKPELNNSFFANYFQENGGGT